METKILHAQRKRENQKHLLLKEGKVERERERERGVLYVRYGIITMKGDGSERGQEKGKGDKAVSVISYISLSFLNFISFSFLFLNYNYF
ncbi:unnamed protein product [Trifolium pratense]|uniref:Uncharacterized protein n=1 Tax=Trifolium pratense TaxID=57577 RepID=A0ACB0K2U8_TRIPR|nr:unnamed protein product [Trifolium pratense]